MINISNKKKKEKIGKGISYQRRKIGIINLRLNKLK